MTLNRQSTILKIFTIVLYTVFINTNSVRARSVAKDCHASCESNECLYYSRVLLKHMDLKVNPCENFYKFACGGYLSRFGEHDTRSTYDDTWNMLLIRIKGLLEQLEVNNEVSGKLKTVFDTCIEKKSSEINAVPQALDFLRRAGIPNWPSMDTEFQFTELSETLGKLSVYGEFAFITFQPSPYKIQNGRHNLPAALILPDNYMMDSKLNPRDVKRVILKILAYFNFDTEESEILWQSFKSLEDEGIKLLNGGEGESSKCTVGMLYSVINCSSEISANEVFLCSFWKSAVKSGDLSRYYLSDILHISCRWNHHNYIENIISRLANINHRSLANYLSLRFFTSHLDDLNFYFLLTKRILSKAKKSERKITESMLKMEYCAGWIIKSMPFALGYEYTQKYLNEQIQSNVLDIIQDYEQELSKTIEHQKWLHKNVKFYLNKQLKKLDIGFKKSMKSFQNFTSVTNYYKEFQPVKDSFLKNILEYIKTSVVTKKENIGFNSFYSSSDSYNMDFGLSLLLPPTYSYGLPKLLNYATLGWIIGHELGHNLKFFFDLVELDDETGLHLKNRMGCLVNKYNQFIIEKTGKKISSEETIEEIIADSIGWSLTEKIIKSFNDTEKFINLLGLEYSPLQIMFISFAQDSCAVLNKEVENEFYSSKPQYLQNLRVLNILQNSIAFSEAFNCSSHEFMNPPDKCSFFD